MLHALGLLDTSEVMKTSILITAIFYHYVLSASVPETFENYTCGEGSHDINSARASTDLNCEQIWTIGDNPIGTFVNGSVECHEPCNRVTSGGITITNCDNLTLTVICLQEYLSEYRVHFHGIINPIPPIYAKKRAHTGILAGLAVLVFIALGLIFQYYKF